MQHQLMYEQSPEVEEDLKKSISVLEDLTGKKLDLFAPGFSITEKNKWAFEILVNQGITRCSVFPAGRAHGGQTINCSSNQNHF